MSDPRPWLSWWRRALAVLNAPVTGPPEQAFPPTEHVPVLPLLNMPVAPDRHEVVEGRATWHATRYVEVIPGSGGRRWKPGTVHTQLMSAVPRDVTEVLTDRRPGWPK